MAVGVACLTLGSHRLPDSANVIATSTGSTKWIKKGGKAVVTLRFRRADHLPVSSKFVVVTRGGQVTHDGPSAGPLLTTKWIPSESVQSSAQQGGSVLGSG
jgi:hypothetical protein